MIARLRILRAMVMIVLLCAIAMVVALLLLLPASVVIKNQYEIAQTQLNQYALKGELIPQARVDALIPQVAGIAGALTAPTSATPVRYMQAITSNIPAGIMLSGISVDAQKATSVTISGTANNRTTLQQFVALLGRIDGVATVDSPVANYVKSQNAEFSITITFK